MLPVRLPSQGLPGIVILSWQHNNNDGMGDKKALFEEKIADANKGPGFERVDHGPNFKPGWKHTGNSGGGHTGNITFLFFFFRPLIVNANHEPLHTGHDGKFKKQTKRVETKFEYVL